MDGNITKRNPTSSRRIIAKTIRRAMRRIWFHVRAHWLGFSIRHALPVF